MPTTHTITGSHADGHYRLPPEHSFHECKYGRRHAILYSNWNDNQ